VAVPTIYPVSIAASEMVGTLRFALEACNKNGLTFTSLSHAHVIAIRFVIEMPEPRSPSGERLEFLDFFRVRGRSIRLNPGSGPRLANRVVSPGWLPAAVRIGRW